jgi:hypothetical protein
MEKKNSDSSNDQDSNTSGTQKPELAGDYSNLTLTKEKIVKKTKVETTSKSYHIEVK